MRSGPCNVITVFGLLILSALPCAGAAAQDTIPQAPKSSFPLFKIANPDSTCPAPRDTIPPPPVAKCAAKLAAAVAPDSLRHVELYTSHGFIDFMVPVAILPGDKVSATMSLNPAGKTERQRNRNLARLQALSVGIGGSQFLAREGPVTFSLEAPPGAPGIFASLLDSRHRVLQATGIAFQPPDSGLGTKPKALVAPSVGAAGHEFLIEGNFAGDSSATQVLFNGVPGKILGETPHGLTVMIPPGQVGPTEISVRESGKTAVTTSVSSVRISLTVENAVIRVGQMTRVRVDVEGLKGIESPIGIVVSNMSPSVLGLLGGDEQVFRLVPAPSGNGQVSFTLQVLGKTDGSGALKADFATFGLAAFSPQG